MHKAIIIVATAGGIAGGIFLAYRSVYLSPKAKFAAMCKAILATAPVLTSPELGTEQATFWGVSPHFGPRTDIYFGDPGGYELRGWAVVNNAFVDLDPTAYSTSTITLSPPMHVARLSVDLNQSRFKKITFGADHNRLMLYSSEDSRTEVKLDTHSNVPNVVLTEKKVDGEWIVSASDKVQLARKAENLTPASQFAAMRNAIQSSAPDLSSNYTANEPVRDVTIRLPDSYYPPQKTVSELRGFTTMDTEAKLPGGWAIVNGDFVDLEITTVPVILSPGLSPVMKLKGSLYLSLDATKYNHLGFGANRSRLILDVKDGWRYEVTLNPSSNLPEMVYLQQHLADTWTVAESAQVRSAAKQP